jgi:hypothetical protein
MPQITRVEGQGNGGNDLDLTAATEASIVLNGFKDNLVYQVGKGPIQVKVVDPLAVRAGKYTVKFRDTLTTTIGDLSDARWTIILPEPDVNNADSINSDQTIELENEQILLNEGISVSIKHVVGPGANTQQGNGVIGSGLFYADETLPWLSGFSDQDNQGDENWIRAGENLFGEGLSGGYSPDQYDDYHDSPQAAIVGNFVDPNQNFENLVGGTWSPYRLLSSVVDPYGVVNTDVKDALAYAPNKIGTTFTETLTDSDIGKTPSVDIVFTADQSKWSRSLVLEARNDVILASGGAKHLRPRQANSVGKNGLDDASGTRGLGWFPGYAINVETGERLNIAFAEDSWLAGENGRDMKWNPTSRTNGGVDFELLLGGKHYVYVFRSDSSGATTYPAYDECAVIHSIMIADHAGDPGVSGNNIAAANASAALFSQTCVWAGIPMVAEGRSLLETTAKIKLRVEKPYESFITSSEENNGLPMYEFDMTGFEVELGNPYVMDSALALINVVPNPYFAYSEYETGKLDKRIKITNLPQECTISIYNVNGTLMRRFQKADSQASLEWELTNQVDVPVATGVYLIHVKVPDVGERTLKWYGVMKPTDLNGFN